MNSVFQLVCPLCGAPLAADGKQCVCPQKHSFDFARQGYLHLLPVQQKHSLHPGDTKEMLMARRRFLDKGYYEPIGQQVADVICRYAPSKAPVIADIGCGEGYYTAMLRQRCHASCIGIDIAKDGVRMACSRDKSILWLVATASSLPLQSASLQAVTAMFSLFQPEEYARVLQQNGIVAEVTVGSRHLTELKEIIYDTVFPQEKHPAPCGEAFRELQCQEQEYHISLLNQDLQSLLMMTPHFWRIRQERREELMQTTALELTVHYYLRVLQKK